MIFREAYDPFRALESAWHVITRAPLTMLVGGGLMWICWGSQQGLPHVKVDLTDAQTVREAVRMVIEAFLSGWLSVIVFFSAALFLASRLFECLLRIGFATAVERVLVTGNQDVGDLFRARGRYGSMVLVFILQALISFAAAIPGVALAGIATLLVHAGTKNGALAGFTFLMIVLIYLPVAIYFWLGISLATYAVAIEDMSATEALSRSWSLVRGRRWILLLYWLVFVLVEFICCLCCCCIPTTFTWVASNESYLRLVRVGEPETWAAPPSA